MDYCEEIYFTLKREIFRDGKCPTSKKPSRVGYSALAGQVEGCGRVQLASRGLLVPGLADAAVAEDDDAVSMSNCKVRRGLSVTADRGAGQSCRWTARRDVRIAKWPIDNIPLILTPRYCHYRGV